MANIKTGEITCNEIDKLADNPLEIYPELFNNPVELNVVRKHPDAIIPYKTRISDVGYDLTIIKQHKTLNSNTIMFDTGIAVKVPWGYYTEVVPRSSLSKTGWMLTNSVGIIDNSYRGNIYVVLTKMNSDAEDIQLPFRGFQLIIRKQYHVIIKEAEEIEDTERGAGGFGSTN